MPKRRTCLAVSTADWQICDGLGSSMISVSAIKIDALGQDQNPQRRRRVDAGPKPDHVEHVVEFGPETRSRAGQQCIGIAAAHHHRGDHGGLVAERRARRRRRDPAPPHQLVIEPPVRVVLLVVRRIDDHVDVRAGLQPKREPVEFAPRCATDARSGSARAMPSSIACWAARSTRSFSPAA